MTGNSDLNKVCLQDENGEIVQVLGRVEDQSQSPTEAVEEVLLNIPSLTQGSKALALYNYFHLIMFSLNNFMIFVFMPVFYIGLVCHVFLHLNLLVSVPLAFML